MSARMVLYFVAAAGLGWVARGATFGAADASPAAPRHVTSDELCPNPAVVAAIAGVPATEDDPSTDSDGNPDPDADNTGDDVGELLARLANGSAATETHNGVHGIVTDQATGSALANVSVLLVQPGSESQTAVTN